MQTWETNEAARQRLRDGHSDLPVEWLVSKVFRASLSRRDNELEEAGTDNPADINEADLSRDKTLQNTYCTVLLSLFRNVRVDEPTLTPEVIPSNSWVSTMRDGPGPGEKSDLTVVCTKMHGEMPRTMIHVLLEYVRLIHRLYSEIQLAVHHHLRHGIIHVAASACTPSSANVNPPRSTQEISYLLLAPFQPNLFSSGSSAASLFVE